MSGPPTVPALPAGLLPWLRAALDVPPPRELPLEGNRASAVLVPVLQRPGGPTVLFVRKSAQLKRHAGQLGFPGGAVDTNDASIDAAALREAWEEVGLEADRVELLGRLDDERTFVTDFHIRPIVGWVAEPPPSWQLDPYEIEAALEVGLAEILRSDPVSWLEFTVAGSLQRAPRFEFEHDVVVWGASARILVNLQQRLRAQLVPPQAP